jgi:hypothetical protein
MLLWTSEGEGESSEGDRTDCEREGHVAHEPARSCALPPLAPYFILRRAAGQVP